MVPSAATKYGLILLLTTASWFMLYPWVAWVTLPFYRRLNIYTAYEYLERRFNVRVRTLAAALFIVWRLGWMGTAIYVPCLAVIRKSAVVANRHNPATYGRTRVFPRVSPGKTCSLNGHSAGVRLVGNPSPISRVQ